MFHASCFSPSFPSSRDRPSLEGPSDDLPVRGTSRAAGCLRRRPRSPPRETLGLSCGSGINGGGTSRAGGPMVRCGLGSEKMMADLKFSTLRVVERCRRGPIFPRFNFPSRRHGRTYEGGRDGRGRFTMHGGRDWCITNLVNDGKALSLSPHKLCTSPCGCGMPAVSMSRGR